MTTTEAEAKTKWCPFVRFGNGMQGVNRWKQSAPENEPHALNPVPCRCIASECMAWRVAEPARDAGPAWDAAPARGYCGLAGQP